MRHRVKGRHLGRNSSHRRAMFRNMANSLILSVRTDETAPGAPKVPGRIVTTLAKAKELRPQVEKLITLACKARVHEQAAEEFATTEKKGSAGWKAWRDGEGWQKWVNANAPALAARRRAFNHLRDNEAVDILFDELAERFEDRPGGYTRIVRLPRRRLGDGGQQALIEFSGENDRPRLKRTAAPVVTEEEEPVDEEPTSSKPDEQTPSAEGESESLDSDAADHPEGETTAELTTSATNAAEEEKSSDSEPRSS